jgi:hypothetical protein
MFHSSKAHPRLRTHEKYTISFVIIVVAALTGLMLIKYIKKSTVTGQDVRLLGSWRSASEAERTMTFEKTGHYYWFYNGQQVGRKKRWFANGQWLRVVYFGDHGESIEATSRYRMQGDMLYIEEPGNIGPAMQGTFERSTQH